MNIALVDDDARQLQILQASVRAALATLGIALRRIDTYTTGEAFFAAFRPRAYDIILLDIYMEKENGVDLARRIREEDTESILAFCTSSNEFASESYEVGAGYYLQKPVSEEKLIAMFKRLNLSKIERSRTVCLPDGFRCLLRHILYTEYDNHTVVFHLKDDKPHSVYMNHADAQALLLHYKFFCEINKGCIVNLAMVKRIVDTMFVMQNDVAIPIARRRFKEIERAYTEYRFEQMDAEVSD